MFTKQKKTWDIISKPDKKPTGLFKTLGKYCQAIYVDQAKLNSKRSMFNTTQIKWQTMC